MTAVVLPAGEELRGPALAESEQSVDESRRQIRLRRTAELSVVVG